MERPKIISFICVIGFILVVLSFPQVFSPAIKRIGMLAPAIYGTVIAFQFISYVGLWYFKQWGARSFFIAMFSELIFDVINDRTGIGFYIFVAVVIFSSVFILKFFSKMDENF